MLGIWMLLATPGYGFDDWLSMRDSGVVRQQRDYSCGAAALATLLTYFYQDPVTEEALLQQTMNDRASDPGSAFQSTGLSFAEMARLGQSRNYPVLGVEVSYSDLKKLRMPVIVALEVHGRAHFSVLRKIDDQDRVFLADPSWGNRQWGRQEFLQSFAVAGKTSRGRVLLVGAKQGQRGDDAYRHRSPRRVLMAPRP
ncbi:peptidase, C39 family [gamma proteobacterium NOR5-3]|nr:peptidase, C39 family [gamma proteobacterium NOR5-3]